MKTFKLLFRVFFIFLVVNCTFYIVHSAAYAADFSSYYKTTYDFNENDEALVEQQISLVSNTSLYYISEYTLSILGGEISDVEAFDKIGPLKISSTKKEDTTMINLVFNEKPVGKGKILSFILKYKEKSLAKKEGNLKQIMIPKISNLDKVDEYTLILKVPKSYGKPSYIDPGPKTQEDAGNKYSFLFEKNSLGNNGIIATFGQYQTFGFKLLYELSNTENKDYYQRISLPPDTGYQNVYYDSLEPLPQDVKKDNDGNWLAEYKVPANSKVTVEAKGQVNVFSVPNSGYKTVSFDPSKYLVTQKYWDTENSSIKDLALKLKTPEQIYNYVVKSLSYNYDAVNTGRMRKGSSEALRNPTNVICSEFTDLFIAIARAAGIPARELEGYAYNDNPKVKGILINNDVLHSWPEYFDIKKNQWIMVDPTFGNTTKGMDFFNKFDMTHFVFVIHGESDIIPAPPGAYKDDGFVGKQIFVSFDQEKQNRKIDFEVIDLKPKKIFSLLNNSIEVKINNTGGMAINNEKLLISAEKIAFINEKEVKIIPPFGNYTYNFLIKPKEYFKDYGLNLTFKINKSIYKVNLLVYSLLLRILVIVGLIFALTLTVILISLKKHRVPKV